MTSRRPSTQPAACRRRPFRPALVGCLGHFSFAWDGLPHANPKRKRGIRDDVPSRVPTLSRGWLRAGVTSRHSVVECTLAIVLAIAALPAPQNLLAASPAGSLVAMFQSGRVPAERAGAIIAVIGNRGDADDLAFLLEMASSDKYDATARTAALEALLDAATSRNVKPSGDLAPLRSLIAPAAPDNRRRFLAVRLAGLWRVAPLADSLAQLALDEKMNQPMRQAAAVSLGHLKVDSDRQTFDKLLAPGQPRPIRLIGVEGLAQHDLEAAATAAAQILASQSETDDPAPLIDIFINHAQGTDRLAAAIDKTKPTAATARRASSTSTPSAGPRGNCRSCSVRLPASPPTCTCPIRRSWPNWWPRSRPKGTRRGARRSFAAPPSPA